MRVNKTFCRGLAFFLAASVILTMVGPVAAETREPGAVVATYRVQNGDTLWNIADDFNLDAELIALMNGLTPDSGITPGQTLTVPAEAAVVHEVREGDSVWSIAKRYGVSPDSIIGENDLIDVNFLEIGQLLAIPVSIDREVFENKKPVVSRGILTNIFFWPVNGIITSTFGMRWGKPHEGLDIAAPQGKAIVAAAGGEVVFAGRRGSYGNAVILEHRGKVRTLYAHASQLLVSAGDRVVRGQPIARVGNTGRSTGPHLHFEIIRKGVAVDPMEFLPDKDD